MNNLRLLMVDDEPEYGTFIRGVAESVGYVVETTTAAEAFKDALRRGDPDVIILDVSMPHTDGIELLGFIGERGTRARILIMSGFDETVRRMALALGDARGLAMAGVLAKPVRAAELRARLLELKDGIRDKTE